MKLSGRMLCRCFASVVLPEHVAPLTKKMDCQIRYCILHVSKTSRLERLRLYMHASTITISVPNADENNEGWRGFLCLDLPTVRRRRCRCRRLLERHSFLGGSGGGRWLTTLSLQYCTSPQESGDYRDCPAAARRVMLRCAEWHR